MSIKQIFEFSTAMNTSSKNHTYCIIHRLGIKSRVVSYFSYLLNFFKKTNLFSQFMYKIAFPFDSRIKYTKHMATLDVS